MTTVALDSPAFAAITTAEPLFHAHGLTKTYHMGEVDVQGLQGVDLDLFSGQMNILPPRTPRNRCARREEDLPPRRALAVI